MNEFREKAIAKCEFLVSYMKSSATTYIDMKRATAKVWAYFDIDLISLDEVYRYLEDICNTYMAYHREVTV